MHPANTRWYARVLRKGPRAPVDRVGVAPVDRVEVAPVDRVEVAPVDRVGVAPAASER